MGTLSTVGLDLAKSVFQVHAADAGGAIAAKRKLRRGDVLAYFAKLPRCLVGIEACGTAHHWAREIRALGHDVRLIPPQYAKAYVKRGKTDAADAAAICEAVTRPSIHAVPIKTVEQQSLLTLHRTRALLVGQRTQTLNAIRSHIAEFGVIAAKGNVGACALLEIIRNGDDTRLPALARTACAVLATALETIARGIAELDARIEEAHKTNPVSRRLDTIPGIAALTATAFAASIGDASVFKSGRSFSAWLGLTPKISGSGGTVTLGEITRSGDRYLRRLLYTGATSVLFQAKKRPAAYPWLTRLLGKLKFKQVAIALANKMARIIWALMVRGGVYRPDHQAAIRAEPPKGSAMKTFAALPA